MTVSEKAGEAVKILKTRYPDAICSLDAEDAFQLLVSTRLSAQCTDARVNTVTPELFDRFPDVYAMSKADVNEVERIIRPCGFFHTKAKDIIAMSNEIIDRFGGRVPDNIEDLITLSGVGRKTANLIAGDIYGRHAVVVDTHMIRISNRLGLVDVKDPVKIEMKLREILPPDESSDFCHRIVLFGRDVCSARKPMCSDCPLQHICNYYSTFSGGNNVTD